MAEHSPYLSVVVAAYNEEAVLADNLRRIIKTLEKHPDVTWELVCVNDGSADSTGQIMDEAARADDRLRVLHHRRNFGQGRALRTAFAACRGEIIVTLDADLSYGPEYVHLLSDILQKKNVEIVLASPYTKGGTVRNVPFYRHLLSRLGNLYLARLSHYPVSTTTCAVRAYRREVLDSMTFSSDGMELQMEILMKASIMGFRVWEEPAHLEWADEKVAEAELSRVSKMRILKTIRLYLMMGWISRPAFTFTMLALLIILPGAYMALVLVGRFLIALYNHLSEGPVQAVSSALEQVFTTYTYSVVFCAALLVIGLQVLAFALIIMQNKFYYDELVRLKQDMFRYVDEELKR